MTCSKVGFTEPCLQISALQMPWIVNKTSVCWKLRMQMSHRAGLRDAMLLCSFFEFHVPELFYKRIIREWNLLWLKKDYWWYIITIFKITPYKTIHGIKPTKIIIPRSLNAYTDTSVLEPLISVRVHFPISLLIKNLTIVAISQMRYFQAPVAEFQMCIVSLFLSPDFHG